MVVLRLQHALEITCVLNVQMQPLHHMPTATTSTPTPLHMPPYPSFWVCVLQSLGFCIINMLQQWFQEGGGKPQQGSSPVLPTFLHCDKRCGWHDNILGYARNSGNLSSCEKMHWGGKTNFNSPSRYLVKTKGQEFIRNYLRGQRNEWWDYQTLLVTLRATCNL